MNYKSEVVLQYYREHGVLLVEQVRFHPDRDFKFDFAHLESKVALECEGGVWSNGRHTRPAGFLKDIEKYNLALTLGWRVVRCVPADLCMDETLDLLKKVMEVSNGN
jgi:hypothetical protein